MSAVVIRRAGLEDLDRLTLWRTKVIREVFGLTRDAPMDELAAANRRYYERELASGGHVAVFAEVNGVTAGCGGLCLYEEMPSPDNPTGQCAYVMNIYVRPSCRRRGVGEAVVTWLVKEARRRGITKIYLETSPAGLPLYRRLGFTPMRWLLHLASERP